MKVRCIANTGSALSKPSIDAGDTVNSEFPINIGELYIVYGISIWKRTINYLIDWKGEKIHVLSHPDWNPAELFEVVDNRIPPDWCFDFRGYEEYSWLNAICGYPELLDEHHYESLIDPETPEDREKAIRIFLQRKKEIDQLYEPEKSEEY